QTFLLFEALVVWTVIAFYRLIQTPTLLTSVTLGITLVFALYTRLEGSIYATLFLLAGWLIYQKTHNLKRAVLLCLVGGGLFTLGALFYMHVMAVNSNVSQGTAFSLIALVRTSPPIWTEVSRRFTASIQALIVNEPVWAWLIALAGILWAKPNE